MHSAVRRCVLVAGLAVAAAGCATLETSPSPDAFGACENWFARLDAAVDDAGVRDAQDARIAGFRYLRVDRFLAAFRGEVDTDARFLAWLERLAALDRAARVAELRNLPAPALAALEAGDAAAAQARSEDCARRLATRDAASAQARARLRAAAQVEDDYRGWQRVLGLYPISRVFFFQGVRAWQRGVQRDFADARAGTRQAATPVRYAPPAAAGDDAALGARLAAAPRDALGVPQLDAALRDALVARHAPVFDIEQDGAHDQPGHPAFDAHRMPVVDAARPTVFARQSFARYGASVLVQLSYTAWFPERPADHAFDLLAGRLDGVLARITLGADGVPLLVDSIHPCGCFHLFLPTPRAEPRDPEDPDEEWAFTPAGLGLPGPGERLRLRLASRSHALVDADFVTLATGTPYALAPEDALRSLPVAGGRRSLYGPDGLVAGTERAERFFFWPMGVPSAGTMRQWGRHATAFVGRRHFDDADLIERRFRLRLR